jgi:hypothetical protein
MNGEMRQAMEIVSVRILEDAAFLFVEPLEEGNEPGPDWMPIGAELGWSGPTRGAMRVWTDPDFLPVLSANMLGIEEDDPAAAKAGADALREVLNMVVGNSLTEAWGPGPVFHLEIPQDADPDLFSSDMVNGFWIDADDHPVLFWCGNLP